MASTSNAPERQVPAWLNETVYALKLQRTFDLVNHAVDTLVK